MHGFDVCGPLWDSSDLGWMRHRRKRANGRSPASEHHMASHIAPASVLVPMGRGNIQVETRARAQTYLRASEAAALLRVSAKTVSRWAKQGKIPHVLTLGGHRRFPRTEVESL